MIETFVRRILFCILSHLWSASAFPQQRNYLELTSTCWHKRSVGCGAFMRVVTAYRHIYLASHRIPAPNDKGKMYYSCFTLCHITATAFTMKRERGHCARAKSSSHHMNFFLSFFYGEYKEQYNRKYKGNIKKTPHEWGKNTFKMLLRPFLCLNLMFLWGLDWLMRSTCKFQVSFLGREGRCSVLVLGWNTSWMLFLGLLSQPTCGVQRAWWREYVLTPAETTALPCPILRISQWC